jgi:Flp pilus assembly protein TadB
VSSKQRAQRRGQAAQQDRAAQQAKAARRKERQEARRHAKVKAGRGRIGWAGMRRSRRQHLGIAAAAAAVIALIWIFIDWQLAIGLTFLVVVATPAIVVLTMGRRY